MSSAKLSLLHNLDFCIIDEIYATASAVYTSIMQNS